MGLALHGFALHGASAEALSVEGLPVNWKPLFSAGLQGISLLGRGNVARTGMRDGWQGEMSLERECATVGKGKCR